MRVVIRWTGAWFHIVCEELSLSAKELVIDDHYTQPEKDLLIILDAILVEKSGDRVRVKTSIGIMEDLMAELAANLKA